MQISTDKQVDGIKIVQTLEHFTKAQHLKAQFSAHEADYREQLRDHKLRVMACTTASSSESIVLHTGLKGLS